MIIAFDAHVFLEEEKTGIGWYAFHLLNALSNNKDYHFIFYIFGAGVEKTKIQNFKKYLDSLELQYEVRICKYMSQKVYKLMTAVVPLPFSCFFRQDADVTFFLNYVIPPGVRGKRITMIHDMTYKVFPETQTLRSRIWLFLSMKRTLRRADAVVTASMFSKSEIIKYTGFDAEKITTISCGVDRNLFTDQYSVAEIEKVKQKYRIEGDYYLYVGTLEPRKNIKRLLQAYSILVNYENSIPQLVIVGKAGWLFSDIFSTVEQLDISDKVIFTGYINEKEIPIMMNGAKIFLYPSLYEGFGMPPLEAMACGTAVITSNVASLPEVVGDCAVLVDPYNIEEIANSILNLDTDEEKREQLAYNGFQRSKMFSWNNVSENIGQLLKKMEEEKHERNISL